MPEKKYLISSFDIGEQTNLEPWLLPEKAFEVLEDAMVWRGRVVKRFGYALIGANDLLSRLRVNIGTTDGDGNLSATNLPGTLLNAGMMFSVGSTVFTVTTVPTVGNSEDTLSTAPTATGSVTFVSTPPNLYTFTISGSDGTLANTDVWFYPALPVMGLLDRESEALNYETVIAFDTQFSYIRSAGGWTRLGTAVWTGNNSNFFWPTNYRGQNPYATNFYVTNNVDPIRYIPELMTTWTDLRPQLDAGGAPTRFLETCLLLLPYKDRLIALNTTESLSSVNENYNNRCRFSQSGDPRDPTTSWVDTIRGRGGFIDAPTKEAIVTAEYIKDTLVVYFERSTWELIYTGISSTPFRWKKINTELGAESTYSIIPFDDGVLGVGNRGVHTCNGVNVSRIDGQIPDTVFKIHNENSGAARVYGIRDYYREVVYWTFPAAVNNPTFPTRILVYNYINQTWAFYNDSFTCFGYFQKDSNLTWATVGQYYPRWIDWNVPWETPQAQSQFPNLIAGNQQGFVLQLDFGRSSNSQALYITDMDASSTSLVVINHNLNSGDYILIEDCEGITGINGIVTQVAGPVSANSLSITTAFSGTYTGNGKITRISNINIQTKQFNPGTPIGLQFRMPYIDFLLNRTTSGEVSLDYISNSNPTSVNEESITGVLLGNNTLATYAEKPVVQSSQSYIWHRYFLTLDAQFIQLRFFMNDSQMKNLLISQSDFEMQAMLLTVEPSGRIIG